MDGSLRYRNVTNSHQENWRNQHNYKEMTSLYEPGNNYHTNVGYLFRDHAIRNLIYLSDGKGRELNVVN